MNRKHLTCLLMATSLLPGCGPTSLRPAATLTPPQPATEREGTAILVQHGRCAQRSMDEAAGNPLVGAVVGVVADFAVSALTAALRRQREGRNATWAATGDATQIKVGTQPRRYCLTVARGVFLQERAANGDFTFRDNPVFLLRLDLTAEAVAGAPAPAAAGAGAGAAAANTSTTVLTAQPYELHYAETSTPVRGSGRKNVSVVIAFSPQTLQPAGGAAATPDTSKARVLRLDFGRLDVGRSYGQRLLASVRAVTTLPGLPDRTTATAVVTESEDSNIALDALISSVESNSDALSNALKATIEEAVGNSDDN